MVERSSDSDAGPSRSVLTFAGNREIGWPQRLDVARDTVAVSLGHSSEGAERQSPAPSNAASPNAAASHVRQVEGVVSVVGGGRIKRQRWIAAAALVACVLTAASVSAAPGDKVFTMGNYPVEAQARDAVAARAKAIAEGQKAALRSILKRLVPVSQYARLRKISVNDAPRMVDSLSVRAERNSSVAYSGNLDFKFQPQAVRVLLEREGLTVADRQAPQIVVVPIWRAPAAGDVPSALGPTEGPKAWTDAWKSLDLEHTLTPVKLDAIKPGTHPDTMKALAAGDLSMWRTFASTYTQERLIAAFAEPDIATKRLVVTLIGNDATGSIAWKKTYRLDLSDPGYAIELAGVVSLGVLEGRWKAVNFRTAGSNPNAASSPAPMGGPMSGITGGASGSGSDAPMIVTVEFRGMSEWTDISRALAATPGIQDLDVLGLSGRSARVTLRYPGGTRQLSDALAQQGLTLRNGGAGWVLAGR